MSPEPDFAFELAYHPRQFFSVITYDALTGGRRFKLKGWACDNRIFQVRDASWYADELFILETAFAKAAVCRLPG